MKYNNQLIDNRDLKLVDYLRARISNAKLLRLVSAYFSVYGFELLRDELASIRNVKFLFGEPSSVSYVDPGNLSTKSFELTEAGISPREILKQRSIARECAEWIETRGVEIRSIRRSNFLHGKMYHIEQRESEGSVLIGSSNFTKRGLGGGANPNLELNLANQSDEGEAWVDSKKWFDALWEDPNATFDVKEVVLKSLARLGRNHSPEFIYFKTLYELFKRDIEKIRANEDILRDSLYDSAIWNQLYEFQRDAVKSIIARLQNRSGCILADSVGLGKTFTALAVIKYFQSRYNAQVLVLCPKKLRQNWLEYRASGHLRGNIFQDDNLEYAILSHTDLSRESGDAGDIDLQRFNWSQFHLVVIDESHNFRNAVSSRKDDDGNVIRLSRYEKLMKDVIEDGGETKVLMLSATPVNTSLRDLRNQISLLSANNSSAFNDIGVKNFITTLNVAQRKFKKWETAENISTRDQIIDELGQDFFTLLGAVSIARSRKQIKRFYANVIEEIGDFPERELPVNKFPHTDLEEELSYESLYDQVSNFKLSIYRPTYYLANLQLLKKLQEEKYTKNFNQIDSEEHLIGMIRTNFLKRLESSPRALSLTLQRTIDKIESLLEKIRKFQLEKKDLIDFDTLPDEDEDDEFIINSSRLSYHLTDMKREEWCKDMEQDCLILKKVLSLVLLINPSRDGKLAQLKCDITKRVEEATTDRDGNRSRKLIIFTAFKDTACYIYEETQELVERLGLNVGLVTGDLCKTNLETGITDNFHKILVAFSPLSHGRAKNPATNIDLLIATDCIAEGQNLQDCDQVLNYDIHWNPVRIVQRFGRIDRIGSRHSKISLTNYWPVESLDIYLRLKPRVEARMELVDLAATGDENRLDVNIGSLGPEEGSRFRDKQLMQLRDEIVDLEDMEETLSMSDFTLDYFVAQLAQFLERNRELLDATPDGSYAVCKKSSDPTAHIEPGVIFCLRSVSNPTEQGVTEIVERVSGPTYPVFLVYVLDSGQSRYTHLQPHKILQIMEGIAVGNDKPFEDLCTEFDLETHNGQNMAIYDTLLVEAIDSIAKGIQQLQGQTLGQRGGIIPKKSEIPLSVDHFELVTWAIIRSGGK